MKKRFLTIAFALLIGLSVFADGLNETAKYFKENDIEKYNKIKTFAEQNFKGDHEMMIYVINQQFDSMIELGELSIKHDFDKKLMLTIMSAWYVMINDKIIYDYEMIVYEYKNQLKAKSQY